MRSSSELESAFIRLLLLVDCGGHGGDADCDVDGGADGGAMVVPMVVPMVVTTVQGHLPKLFRADSIYQPAACVSNPMATRCRAIETVSANESKNPTQEFGCLLSLMNIMPTQIKPGPPDGRGSGSTVFFLRIFKGGSQTPKRNLYLRETVSESTLRFCGFFSPLHRVLQHEPQQPRCCRHAEHLLLLVSY